MNHQSFIESFRAPRFRWLWGSTLANNSARYSVIFIASWMSYDFTSSVLGASLVAFLGFAPPLFFGPLVGTVADKIERVQLIRMSSGLGAITSLFVVFAGELGKLNLFLSLFLALVAGVCFTLEQPARISMVPSMVKQENLLSAYSAVQTSAQGAQLIGPAIATVALVLYGASGSLVVCALLYSLAFIQALRISSPQKSVAYGRDLATSEPPVTFRQGLSYIRRNVVIGSLIIFVGFHCSLTMAYMGLLPSFVTMNLNGNSSTFGLLMTLVGAGAVLGSLLLSFYSRGMKKTWLMLLTAILSGATLMLLAIASSDLVADFAAVGIGASQAAFMILIQSRTQSASQEMFRGRVAGITFFFTAGVMGLSSLSQGYLAGFMSPEIILAGTGLSFVMLTFGLMVHFPGLRDHFGSNAEHLASDKVSSGIDSVN